MFPQPRCRFSQPVAMLAVLLTAATHLLVAWSALAFWDAAFSGAVVGGPAAEGPGGLPARPRAPHAPA